MGGGYGLILSYVVDEVVEGTVQVPTVQPEPNKANPKLGIGSMAFSADSRYLYSKNGQSLQRFLSHSLFLSIALSLSPLPLSRSQP